MPGPVPLVVSLTTLPSRIGHLRATLDSLLGQTHPPDQILLCLPDFSVREQASYPHPAWLDTFTPRLRVVHAAADDGPGTKLLGALPYLTDGPCCLVIVDDDMQYGPSFLGHLYDHQVHKPGASFSFYTYGFGPLVVGQGADGFSFHSPNLVGVADFAAAALASPALRLVDDLWISGYLYRRGIPVRDLRHLLTEGETIYSTTHAIAQLRHLEGVQSRQNTMQAGLDFMLREGLLGRGPQLKRLVKAALQPVLPGGRSPHKG